MKIIEGHELQQFKGCEGGTLEIWSKQTIEKLGKNNVSNDYVF